MLHIRDAEAVEAHRVAAAEQLLERLAARRGAAGVALQTNHDGLHGGAALPLALEPVSP